MQIHKVKSNLKAFTGLWLNNTNNYCANRKKKAMWPGHSNYKSLA